MRRRSWPGYGLPAFAHLRRIYKACGAEKRCHLVVGEGGHRFYADDAWLVMLREIVKSL